jgi:hypothetical protein
MASESIHVFVKLLSGDLITLVDELCRYDPVAFPVSKTSVFHMDEEKGDSLCPDDMLGVFVSHFSWEKDVFLYRYQETYDLFIIPLKEITLYVYYRINNTRYFNGRDWTITYFVCKEEYPHIERNELWRYSTNCLYNAVCHLYPISPEEMKEVYEAVFPNVEKQMKEMIRLEEKNIPFTHSVERLERVICECGSTVTRKLLNAHRKTKKHTEYLSDHSPLIQHEQTYTDVGPLSESFRYITTRSFYSHHQ